MLFPLCCFFFPLGGFFFCLRDSIPAWVVGGVWAYEFNFIFAASSWKGHLSEMM